jgi:hypothetical protein
VNRTKNFLRDYSPITTGDLRSAPTSASNARLARLSHALIAKSLVEGLFVVVLAVYFSYTNFNPYFRGSVDVADARVVSGWVVNEASRGERVEVYLYVDGHFVARRLADAPRPDVFEAGLSSDAYHGFIFPLPPLPPNRTYEARVYAVHAGGGDTGTRRAMQEFGGARKFSVTADGTNSAVPDAWWEDEGRR